LEHEIETFAVLVREDQAKVKPEVVLAIALDDRICTMSGLSGIVFVGHWELLLSRWDVLRRQAPRMPGACRRRRRLKSWRTADTILAIGRSSNACRLDARLAS